MLEHQVWLYLKAWIFHFTRLFSTTTTWNLSYLLLFFSQKKKTLSMKCSFPMTLGTHVHAPATLSFNWYDWNPRLFWHNWYSNGNSNSNINGDMGYPKYRHHESNSILFYQNPSCFLNPSVPYSIIVIAFPCNIQTPALTQVLQVSTGVKYCIVGNYWGGTCMVFMVEKPENFTHEQRLNHTHYYRHEDVHGKSYEKLTWPCFSSSIARNIGGIYTDTFSVKNDYFFPVLASGLHQNDENAYPKWSF